MRKTLLILTCSAGLSAAMAQTQIGNSDFEQWETSTSENKEPVNWNSFKSASGSSTLIALYGSSTMGRSNQVHPGGSGTYAGKIWSKQVLTVVANGNMTLGRINMGSSTATDPSNYNATVTGNPVYSESFNDTPDSLVVWVKFYSSNAATNARVSTVIHDNSNFKDPNDVGSAGTVATAILNFQSNGAIWKRLSIPFTYVASPPTSSYIITTFTTSATPGGGNANDSLIVDDLQLVYVPKASFTSSTNSVCAGSSITFTNTSTNYPTSYSWNFGDGSPLDNTASPSHTYANPGSYQVTLTATNQWGSTTTTAYTITVNALDDANFNYASNTICLSGSNETPTVASAGTFSATPAGLSFVSTTTGEINVGGSSAGTYTVTYTTSGTCPSSSNSTITITSAPDANFSYANTSYCQSATDPSPVFGAGASAGSFTVSPSGLTIDGNTGSLDLSASNAGTYTVTNTIAASGSCPMATGTFNITVVANPTVTLGNFTQVCTYTPAFALTGGMPAGGTYSGTGVSGGNFDPSVATANANTTITYTYTDGATTCTNTASNTIFVSECLGLEDATTALVNVYPNPSTGLVHVTNISGKQVVEVINALGTVVQKRTLSASDNTLDLSNLNSGVYFVRVENQLFRIVKK